jgi:membrane protease YdiL (CAAX protease family)
MSHKDQKNGEFALNEKISNAILIFLLFVRLADPYLPVGIFGSNTREWYAGIVYILTVAIIWLNRHRLAALNIDRPFIAALVLGGICYAFYIQSVGIFVGISVGLIYWAYQTNQLVFKNPVPYRKETGLLILLTIPVALAPILLFRPTLKIPLDFQVFGATFLEILIPQLAGIVFEEVLFRGALWAYVRGLGLTEHAAFYIQAVLFWVSHHEFLLRNPYFFWVDVPIIAIMLGLMTWRSKSLTPSTISHFLFNLTSGLMMKIF